MAEDASSSDMQFNPWGQSQFSGTRGSTSRHETPPCVSPLVVGVAVGTETSILDIECVVDAVNAVVADEVAVEELGILNVSSRGLSQAFGGVALPGIFSAEDWSSLLESLMLRW